MFDPLTSPELNSHQPIPNTYWQTTDNYIDTEQLKENISADVVIIGAGYTGLSCAIELARAGINNIVVIEANTIGWGCSGRNAGFVLPGSGRLSYQQLVDRFGKSGALKLHSDYLAGTELIESLSKDAGYTIDSSEVGYLKLAHSQPWLAKLEKSARYLAKEFDYQVEFINKQKLQQEFVNHQKVTGAIRYTNGYGINPLKLINSYAKLATSLGVKIYTQSSVNHIHSLGQQHRLTTKLGSVTSDKLVIATNGYTTKNLTSPLQNKILPVLTNVVVTRPLTPQELQASNFKTQQVMMDTRELKYYYRLLPDNRLLFGGRGAIAGKNADAPIYQQRLLNEIKSTFTGLANIDIDYNWIGWIAVAMDQMPHLYGTQDNVYYSTGYCGSGVSFATLAGKQLAQLINSGELDSPLYSPLPKFPFAKYRRFGQALFYQYGRIKDSLGV